MHGFYNELRSPLIKFEGGRQPLHKAEDNACMQPEPVSRAGVVEISAHRSHLLPYPSVTPARRSAPAHAPLYFASHAPAPLTCSACNY